MHDVDVRLILIVHLIQNQLVLEKKTILRFMELCIVKVKTKGGNSFRKKKFGQLRYGRF